MLMQVMRSWSFLVPVLTSSTLTSLPASWRSDNTLHYLGSLKQRREPPNPKYVDYASSSTMPRRSFRPGRREEFTKCLSDMGVGIDSNDVAGIRKVCLQSSAILCQLFAVNTHNTNYTVVPCALAR